MSVNVEKLENSMVKLTIEVAADEFENACEKTFQKNKNQFNVPGFRKGKVPRKMIEKMYGEGVFFEDAANSLIPGEYAKAYDEASKEVEIMSQPEINVVKIAKGEPFVFTATVATRPEVTLGTYKGIEVTKNVVEVTDEDIEKAVKAEQEKNGRSVEVTDRAVKSGDKVSLNFEGFVDGVAFEGGKGEDYPLEIGSGSFIPGFEDQIIDQEIGKEFDVNVTFPENYNAKDLAGKPAVFKCKVNSISGTELPEVNDEFASEVSDFDTLAEWKEHLAEDIRASKQAQMDRLKKDQCVEAASTSATVEIPEAIIDTEARNMVNNFAQQMQSQGLSMEQYMQYTNSTWDKLAEEMKPEAAANVRSRLVLEAIVKAENIEVSDEELEEEIKKMAEMYQMEVDKLKEYLGEEEQKNMKKDMSVQKAVEFLAENAVEVEKKEEADKEEK